MNRGSLIVIASIGMVALVLPSSAFAASTTALDGDYGVQFDAAFGEVNTVTVTNDSLTFIINDSTAPVSAGPGCFTVDAHTVQCYTDHEWELDVTLRDMNDTLSFQSQGLVSAQGGDGADQLVTTLMSGASFDGENGADTLIGAGQNDMLDGGPGADVIRGGPGRDNIIGGKGADTIHGGSGPDWLIGWTGPDIIYGNADRDKIYGGGGTDHIRGGGGADLIHGGNVITTPDPTDRGDWLYGGAGGDRLFGGPGFDHLFGGIASDICRTQTDGGTTKSC